MSKEYLAKKKDLNKLSTDIESVLEKVNIQEQNLKNIDNKHTQSISALEQDLNTVDTELQNQINNIVLTASGSGDVAAEVAQARVNADGVTSETLKGRLDAMDTTTEIISTANPKSLSLGTFEMGALTGNDGKPLSDTSTIRSGFILVDGIIKVKLSAMSGYTFNLYQYKPDKTIVTTSYNYYSSEKEWILEENTKYIRVTLRKTSGITVEESSNLSALYSTELSNVNDRVGAVEASLVPDSINNELSNWTMGYLSSNNGAYNSSTSGSYYVTNLIPINGVAKLVTKTTSDFKCKLFVYNESKVALRSQYNYYSGEYSWDAKNAAYFRIGITTTAERVISDVTEITNNVTVDLYSIVADLYDKATIKDYATDSCDLKGKIDITSGVDEFCALYENVAGKTEAFLFFSDCHIYTSQNIDGSDGMLTAIQKVHNSIPSKFVVDGGDILQNNDTRAVACAKLSKYSGKCKYLFDKCYRALGNHDTNYQGVDSTGTANTGILSNSAITALLFEEYGKNYYSFSGSNTKFWVLDSGTDWNNDIDQYRETQLMWLAEELANDNSENKAIITHIYFNEGAEHTFGLEIKKIVAAFNTRGTYSIGSSNEVSFASATGKIKFVLCGHTHVDMNDVIGGTTPVICIKKALSGNNYAFDAILVDYDANVINCVRFGDGDSRKFSLTTGELQ